MRSRSWLIGVGLAILAACGSGGSRSDSGICTVLGGTTSTAAGQPLRRLQSLQVSIEVRFLTVTETFVTDLGFDFDSVAPIEADPLPSFGGQFVIGADRSSGAAVTGGASGSTNVVPRDHHNGIFLPRAFFANNPDLGDALSFVQAPGDDGQCLSLAPGASRDLQFGTGSFGVTPFAPFGGPDPESSLGFAILSDIEAFFLIDAVQGDARTDVTTAPKVTLFNGQRAIVSDIRYAVLPGDLKPFVNEAISAIQPKISIVRTGLTLDIRATLSPDGRSVELEVRPTSHAAILESTVPVTIGGSAATIQIPIIETAAVKTTVLVPDGASILLGGLKDSADDGSTGVPLFSQIPYINRLFRSASVAASSENLMILVTPRILIQD